MLYISVEQYTVIYVAYNEVELTISQASERCDVREIGIPLVIRQIYDSVFPTLAIENTNLKYIIKILPIPTIIINFCTGLTF